MFNLLLVIFNILITSFSWLNRWTTRFSLLIGLFNLLSRTNLFKRTVGSSWVIILRTNINNIGLTPYLLIIWNVFLFIINLTMIVIQLVWFFYSLYEVYVFVSSVWLNVYIYLKTGLWVVPVPYKPILGLVFKWGVKFIFPRPRFVDYDYRDRRTMDRVFDCLRNSFDSEEFEEEHRKYEIYRYMRHININNPEVIRYKKCREALEWAEANYDVEGRLFNVIPGILTNYIVTSVCAQSTPTLTESFTPAWEMADAALRITEQGQWLNNIGNVAQELIDEAPHL